jgi:hypothetical protein
MRNLLSSISEMDSSTKEHQKFLFEQLRKSINGIVNKVNVSNI